MKNYLHFNRIQRLKRLLCSFVAVLFTLTSLYAQDIKTTISAENITVKSVLEMIEQQANCSFAYKTGVFDPSQIVSINATNEDVVALLSRLIPNIELRVDGKTIYIYPKVEESASAKFVDMRGVIVDHRGNVVLGATIVDRATNRGTTSTVDGSFVLSGVNANSLITISSLGYKSLEVRASTSRTEFVLEQDLLALDEVVVVGYGTSRKENLTGAVDQITAADIENRVATSIDQILQGVSPNLNITFSDGSIDGSASFDIRGTGSINGGEPLVLIDGVEGEMNYVNPKDIASISVLKDASSAAIYGARAAFGVILITTKSPEKGKTKVSYSNSFGWSNPTINTDGFITDGLEWARLSDQLSLLENTSTYLGYSEEDYAYMEARKSDSSLPSVLIKEIDGEEYYIHYGNTDWWDVIFQSNQFTMDHNVSISGGDDKIKYYTSARYHTKEGIYAQNPDVLRSYTLRNKIDFQLNSKMKLTNSTNLFFSKYTYPATNNRSVSGSSNSEDWRKYTYHASPLFEPTNPDGTIMINSAYSSSRDIADGSFADLTYGKSKGEDREQDISNTIAFQYEPIEGLVVNGDYSLRMGTPTSQLLLVSTPYTNQPGGENILYYKESEELYKEMHWRTSYQAINGYATYTHTFNDDHNVKGLIGFNQEWRTWERTVARRSDPISEDLGSFNLASGDLVQIQGNSDEWAIRGAFYRFNYDYKGRYLVEFNGRFDLSSKFPTDSRLGIFPSASAAWRVSEERWYEPIKDVVNSMKLRASYGTLGNQDVGCYDYIATMESKSGNYISNGSLNTYLSTPDAVSSNFTWERTQTLDFGVDLTLLGNRLVASYDWFRRDTKDMLTQGQALPSVFGTDEPMENAADLRTRGFELSIEWRDKFKLANRDFSYRIGFSLADSRTYITKFDNPDGQIDSYYVGKELGEVWGYSIEGFFLSDDEYLSHADQTMVNQRIENYYLVNHPVAGDLKFKDLDGDGAITPGSQTLSDPGDLIRIGNTSAHYTTGISLGFNYAGFDVSVFMQGVLKQDWWPEDDNSFFWGPFTRQYETFYPKSIVDDCWTPENPDAYFPRLAVYAANEGGYYEGSQLSVRSDKYLQNAAYLRVKDITISYTVPQHIVKRLHESIDKVRIYGSGQNLFTYSPLYKHNPDRTVDPEQLGDGNAYPFSKTISFGIDVTF